MQNITCISHGAPNPAKRGCMPPNCPENIDPVLIITPWYKPTIGGVAVVADRLHHYLTRKGVETHLFVCEHGASRKFLESVPDCQNVWNAKLPDYIFERLSLKSVVATIVRGVSALWKLSGFLRARNIRTVILLYPGGYAWPFLVLKHMCGVRIVASYHGNDLTKYERYPVLLRWLSRKILLNVDAITVCARHLAEIAKKIVAPSNLTVQLIGNCVDPAYFFPPFAYSQPCNSQVTLIHISNFNPKKRAGDIVKAFAMAEFPVETRLVMVGNGPEHCKTRELAQSLGVAERIEFAGAQKDIRPFLWKSDIFVLASDDEGAPLVLLEAMASGLPWISTPWGVAEILPPGECGLVVPAASPKDLAAAIEQLVGDPERRKTMGERGRYRTERDFSINSYIEEHCRLIHRIQD
jgi:glycosyltransferase involved in cell wall biosynthesis